MKRKKGVKGRHFKDIHLAMGRRVANGDDGGRNPKSQGDIARGRQVEVDWANRARQRKWHKAHVQLFVKETQRPKK